MDLMLIIIIHIDIVGYGDKDVKGVNRLVDNSEIDGMNFAADDWSHRLLLSPPSSSYA